MPARHCYHKSLTPLMEEVREQMGSGPVYISFDIDALDPSFAPGTGASKLRMSSYSASAGNTVNL